MIEFKVTYDKAADAAYISLVEIGPGEAARQVVAVPDQIILDFDRENRLLGIEILDAKRTLPASILRGADAPRFIQRANHVRDKSLRKAFLASIVGLSIVGALVLLDRCAPAIKACVLKWIGDVLFEGFGPD